MPAKKNVVDAVVRHRIDVQRFGRSQAEDLIELMAEEDAALIAMLRRRLPHVAANDIRKSRAQALLQAAREARQESMRELRDVMKSELREFLKVEIEAIGASMSRAAGGVVFDTVSADVLRGILARPIAVGEGTARTIAQWIDDIIEADARRVVGALQHAIATGTDVAETIRLLSGSRAAKFSDGLLAQTRRQLETLIQTASKHAAEEAMLAWGEANSGLVIGWMWVTMLDLNVCKRCRAQRGRFIPNGSRRPPKGMKMADYRRGPPIHGRDRCVKVPIFDQRALAQRL